MDKIMDNTILDFINGNHIKYFIRNLPVYPSVDGWLFKIKNNWDNIKDTDSEEYKLIYQVYNQYISLKDFLHSKEILLIIPKKLFMHKLGEILDKKTWLKYAKKNFKELEYSDIAILDTLYYGYYQPSKIVTIKKIQEIQNARKIATINYNRICKKNRINTDDYKIISGIIEQNLIEISG